MSPQGRAERRRGGNNFCEFKKIYDKGRKINHDKSTADTPRGEGREEREENDTLRGAGKIKKDSF